MASLTFANVETRVANQLRLPTSNTTEMTKLDAIINMVYREIGARTDWYWLLKRTVINTVDDYSTGTVNVTSGSTSVTASATISASKAGQKLLITGDTVDSGAVYRITSHTAGTDAITIDAAFTGATNTTASYHIYQDTYDLPADLGAVVNITRYGYEEPLRIIPVEEMHRLKSWDLTSWKPHTAAIFDYDTTGDPTTQRQLIVHPYPDDTYRLEIHYRQALNTEVSSSTRFHFPDDWIHVLDYGVLARGYPIFLNDAERGVYYQGLFETELQRMVGRLREWDGYPHITPDDVHRGFYRNDRTRGRSSLRSYFGRVPYNP